MDRERRLRTTTAGILVLALALIFAGCASGSVARREKEQQSSVQLSPPNEYLLVIPQVHIASPSA